MRIAAAHRAGYDVERGREPFQLFGERLHPQRRSPPEVSDSEGILTMEHPKRVASARLHVPVGSLTIEAEIALAVFVGGAPLAAFILLHGFPGDFLFLALGAVFALSVAALAA